MLLETYKYASANGWCKINSRFLLAEMEKSEQFVGSSGKIREDHVTGEHDDRKFAMAMAYFTWHDSDLMAERSKAVHSSCTLFVGVGSNPTQVISFCHFPIFFASAFF